MPKFHVHLPKANGDWSERTTLVSNVYALEEAFNEGKIETALICIKGEKQDRYAQCDHVRPVGVWTPNHLCSVALGFSPQGKMGEDRVPYTDIISLTFRLK